MRPNNNNFLNHTHVIYLQCKLSDSSAPLSLPASPSNVTTWDPNNAWQLLISISIKVGNVLNGAFCADSHNILGPTQTPKFAADMRLNRDFLATLCNTHTTYLSKVWFSLGMLPNNRLRRSNRPLVAAFNHSCGFPASNGSGKLRRKSFMSPPNKSGGVEAISSHIVAPETEIQLGNVLITT